MIKLFVGLLLVLSTLPAFAKDCNSLDLNKEFNSLMANDDISLDEKNDLFKAAKKVKLAQILTCSGLKQVYLSKGEDDFAKQELAKDKNDDIDKIKTDEKRLKSLLLDPDLDDVERSMLSQSLDEIPSRLQEVEDYYVALGRYLN